MALLLFGVPLTVASNPVGWPQAAGMADTNIHFFNNTFLAFSTHDFAPNNTGFLMKDWWVWSSPDLVEWSLESIVNPKDSVKWSTPSEQDECWATDAAFVNDTYYFYLSVGPGTIGVVTADHYTGPWTDPLGKPLLDHTSEPGATFRDPCVFEEDDGSHYIIAGVFDYYIAKLGSDMITLAEPLKKVIVNHPYGPCGPNVTDDKPFIHKENGIYYLSWGCFYGMSKSIYGPYETMGAVINTTMLAPAFRMNDTMELEPGTTVDDIFASRVQQRLRGSSGSSSSRRPPVHPAAGQTLGLHNCSTAAPALIEWEFLPTYSVGKPFQAKLKGSANPDLCISASSGGDAQPLKLEPCAASSPSQQINVATSVGGTGMDVSIAANCPCWNVQDNNARAKGNRGKENALVQCYSCVDGSNFNPNQRFDFSSSAATGQIKMWKGYAPGYCVGATLGSQPPSPPPPAPPSPPQPEPWFKHEDYADRHGSFLKHAGQWYYASNDRSHSIDKQVPAVYRDTVLCYIHFRSDGTMEPCVVNAAGVGTHDVRNGPVEAEEYGAVVGGSKLDLRPLTLVLPTDGFADGFAIKDLGDGSELSFPKVTGITPNAATTLRLLLAHADNDKPTGYTLRLTARSGSAAGRVLGSCVLPFTGSNANFQWVECATFTTSFGQLDLVFTFASDGGAMQQEHGGAQLDKFELV